MNHTRKVMAVGLVVCMLLLPISDASVWLNAKSIPTPALIKQQVERWGVGANVKVKLQEGKKLRGSIAEIEEQGFTLEGKGQGPSRRIAYADLTELELARRSYRASGQPDPAEARRVVEALGVGKHVMVKTTGAKEYHGNIQAIGADRFTLLPDQQNTAVEITYRDVWQVEKNMSTATIVVLAVGITIVVLVLSLYLKLTTA